MAKRGQSATKNTMKGTGRMNSRRGRPVVRLSLAEARARRALSLADLAELSGVDRGTIWRIEAGRSRPYPATRHKLADALKFDVDEIAWV